MQKSLVQLNLAQKARLVIESPKADPEDTVPAPKR